jgi:hypothetical protein
MPDCRNDCIDPLLFPMRPQNRPGLSHIAYRIGTYSDFREALLRKLDQSAVLSAWTHRGSDDAGIALLEGAAILGDILTFYQELYANEAYLRTSTLRESISDLVRLIGYRLAPGLGGKAIFAIEVKGSTPVIVPAGFPIKADVTGLPDPSDFETTAPTTAVPSLGRFALYRPFVDAAITTGTSKFSFDTASGVSLEPKDRIMLVVADGTANPVRQIVVVDAVETQFERTEITIKGAWQGGAVASPISAYKLGRSFRWFGYNAPPTQVTVSGGTATQTDVDFDVELSGPDFSGSTFGIFTRTSFPLDKQVDDLAAGSLILVSLETELGFGISKPSLQFFERTIVSVAKSTETVGAMTGGATAVTLNQGLASSVLLVFADLRTAEFHEVIGAKFPVRGVRVADASATDKTHLYFFGDGETYKLLDGRQIQLVRSPVIEEPTVSIDAGVVSPESTLRRIHLAPALTKLTLADFPLRNSSVTGYGNLADATQGKTERVTVLGNGDSREAFQTFKLPKSPLTYLPSTSATPPQTPQLQITVDGLIWKQVPSFFGKKPDAQIYIVREDANGDSWVQFGDGIAGALVPSGVDNVVAKWRTGFGAFGPTKPDAKPQAGAKLDRLDKITLADEASGGSNPEPGDVAREAAPGKIQSLGRLVSIRDFETEALTISGVTKVSAAWDLINNVPTMVVIVLMETGRDPEIEQVRQTLDHYNSCRGPHRFPIKVIQGDRQFVYVDAVFALAASFQEEPVKAAVKQSLIEELFALRNRRFGQPEYQSTIEGTIQNVAGVAWAKVTAFGLLAPGADPTKLATPPEPKPLQSIVSCPPARVLALFEKHLQLNVAAPPSAPPC